MLTPPSNTDEPPPPMGNITMHPHSAAVQANSQDTLNATITVGNSIIDYIQFERNDGEIEDDEEEEWGDINEFSSTELLLNECCIFYMDGVPILSENLKAVEFVYMIEAELLICSQNVKEAGVGCKVAWKIQATIPRCSIQPFQ